MKITQMASKPQLVKLTLDSKEIVKKYGEPVEFWTWDRQPLEIFMRLASAGNKDQSEMIDVLRKLILDENGSEVIRGEETIPSDVLVAAMQEITKMLGK